MIGQSVAVIAGLCAAAASVCAKLAMAGEETVRLCAILLGSSSDVNYCQQIELVVRILFFVLVFVFNALMWTLFVRALRKCSSSLEATVCNTAANFFFTALLGNLLFGEVLTLKWWLGASFILCGLLVIFKSDPRTLKENEQRKKSE